MSSGFDTAPDRREQDGPIERPAAALQDVHGKPAIRSCKRDAKRGGRGFVCCARLAKKKHERTAAFCGDREAPQLGITDELRPGEHRAAGMGAQGLFCRPQCFFRRAGFYDEELREIDSRGGERRRVGEVGRGDPCEMAPFRRQACERRPEDAQLAYAFVCGENFRERARRPAAAG